jgi:exopolysaccharide biosynthesis polyprenyl glycosylphosphotransferase
MNNAGRSLLLKALKLFDLGLMVLAFMVAVLAVIHHRATITIFQFFSMRIKIQNFVVFLLFMLVWHIIFKLSDLYTSRRLCHPYYESIDIIKATTLGTVVIFIVASIARITVVSPLFLFVFWLTSMCSTVSARLVLRTTLAFVRKRGRNLRDVVIVGTNNRALEFAGKLASNPELGYRIAGFVDCDWGGMEAFQRSEFALVSDFDCFLTFLRNAVVDEVVIALPFRSMYAQARRIAALCEEQGITVRVLTSIFDLKIAHSSAGELVGNPLITHSTGSVEGWQAVTKRTLDFAISSLLIVWLFPVLIVVAILIKLASPGPILFVQKRIGLNKRQFSMFKFRTMVLDAEKRIRDVERLNEVSGPVFKIKNDPRITPLGAFFRKTSIDELPQLFNVLRGEMSLVGPRPLPVRDYEGFNEDWQRRRFSVKPGMTCLWQVRGRSSISFEKWMELDLQYIDGWSLWLDFQILMLTIPAVFRGSGAV